MLELTEERRIDGFYGRVVMTQVPHHFQHFITCAGRKRPVILYKYRQLRKRAKGLESIVSTQGIEGLIHSTPTRRLMND